MVRSDRGHGRADVGVVVVAGEAEGVAVVVTAGEEGERAGSLLGVVVVCGQTVLLRRRRRVQTGRDGRGRPGGGRIEEVLQRRHGEELSVDSASIQRVYRFGGCIDSASVDLSIRRLCRFGVFVCELL